jgi:hypothetical protein
MNKLRFTINALAVMVFTLACFSFAQAQATRTWVSGVGDDVNPCSRTAPCKTFAGAISKTAIGGEIDALDPGGFGAVTITKSITIDGGSAFASVLASGVNGINVSIASGNANDPERRVVLRRLSINGTGISGTAGVRTGVKGINVNTNGAVSVLVENCYIQNFTQEGITWTAAGGYLSVKDTNIFNCNVGINAQTATGVVVAALDHVRIEKMSANGITYGQAAFGTISNSWFQFNGGDGISMASNNTIGQVHVESSVTNQNGSAGTRSGGAGSTLTISNTRISGNSIGPATGGGAFVSHGNNEISGNGTAGTAPSPNLGQQ